MPIPRATARLQLHAAFDFDAAAATVDYYARLGISHLYTSPILSAQPDSTHGYDGVDVECVSPALGGEAGLRRLVDRLHAAGMGLIIDIVPNHMGIAGANNVWWQDVLEYGPASTYATWFDIDWNRPDEVLRNKVLLPFLGDQYGQVLAAGELKLQFDSENGKLFIGYHTNRFPVAPETYPASLRQALDSATNIDPALALFDATTPTGAAALHALLEKQHYRLAWWRYGADGLNWRRFFEVTDLAGMRVESDEVFEATHAVVLRLYAQGLIDGVRVDHVDGLADPTGYCQRLRHCLARLAGQRPQGDDGPAYIVVEKILATHELLRSDWQVDGTTGYDFMDQVGGFLHTGEGAAGLDLAWADVAPQAFSFADEVRSARRQLLAFNLAAEFDAACQALLELARTNLSTRDYSLNAIRRVFTEILVQFPVYRTYVHDAVRGPTDQQAFAEALTQASSHIGRADIDLLGQLDRWLGGEMMLTTDALAKQARAIRRFQQLTPPLVAKSVEDTAFYRYGRALSRNQVGSDPGQFAVSPAGFDAAVQIRAKQFPHTMLATATHDHKRGEDVTARLAILSEVPGQWRSCLHRWRKMNARHHAQQSSDVQVGFTPTPSPVDEVMLYQTLVGVWPIGLTASDTEGLAALQERVAQWQQKAVREAKIDSDWVMPNLEYEQGCHDFLEAILSNPASNLFLAELIDWIEKITSAGLVNSLTQTVLRLTLPGVPDLYQGTDLWDFSLVDPDNRRAVDYRQRKSALSDCSSMHIAQIAWQSGALKQRLIHDILACRQRYPEVFTNGGYEVLVVMGALAGSVFAYRRYQDGIEIIVIVTRIAALLTFNTGSPCIDAGIWGDTTVLLPAGSAGVWVDVVTNSRHHAEDHALSVSVALADATIAVLINAPDAS